MGAAIERGDDGDPRLVDQDEVSIGATGGADRVVREIGLTDDSVRPLSGPSHRGSVLSLKEKEFVEASRAIGTPHRVIITRHILPNVISPLLVLGTLRVANIIIWESGLSFLGMGVPPPMPTWGRMLAEGRIYITDAWWLVTLPGLAIMVTILSINLLGDGLRDALDPRLRNI